MTTPTASTASAATDVAQQSNRLSWRRRCRQTLLFVVLPMLLVGGGFGFWRYHLKRFEAVAPGVLYRSGQPTEWGMQILSKLIGVKTVVSLQLFDFKLHRGPLDFGRADGSPESAYVRSAGMNHVQWPMGVEQCWPWPTPWEFEQFFALIDDPRNHPVVVHCMGGRHRTGTLAALYRLEYDRLPIEAVLEEMYSFKFGGAIPAQEHHLRTYVARPQPTAEQFAELMNLLGEAFPGAASGNYAGNYAELIRVLRSAAGDPKIRDALENYIRERRPFALPLAARLIDRPDDPLAPIAVAAARALLDDRSAADADVLSAAALIADFGSPAEQEHLLDLLRHEAGAAEPSAFYESLVRGVTNRYTRNRLAFLRPLLEDVRPRRDPALAKYRYCDTAVYRVAAITDELPALVWDEATERQVGPDLARKWFAANAAALELAQLIEPPPTRVVQVADGTEDEDLSKMRR